MNVLATIKTKIKMLWMLYIYNLYNNCSEAPVFELSEIS